MCPHPAASLITLTSSTRFRPDAYITCWLESIETVDPIDLTEERFDAAIASDERLNAAFDIIAASAVEQFSAHVLHGRVKLARRLPMFRQFI
jgi:hypothetical protein